MNNVLVGITVTYEDWLSFRVSIIESVSNITDSDGFKGGVLLVIQCEKQVDVSSIGIPLNYEYVLSFKRGVSVSRNEVLEYAVEFDFNYIIFHDACAFFSKSAGMFISDNPSKYTKKITQVYSEEVFECYAGKRFYKANPIYQTYIGSYLLNLKYINHKFDEGRGPGSLLDLHSGEDVLFLFEYFRNAGGFIVEELVGSGCFHPPRSKDYSKHLLYARGQGALYRIILERYLSARLVRDFIIFCVNSFFRVFAFKKNAIKILILRFKGFIYGK